MKNEQATIVAAELATEIARRFHATITEQSAKEASIELRKPEATLRRTTGKIGRAASTCGFVPVTTDRLVPSVGKQGVAMYELQKKVKGVFVSAIITLMGSKKNPSMRVQYSFKG